MRRRHGFFQDEQGDKSLSRLSLIIVLVFTLALVACEVFGPWAVPTEAYALLGGLLTALVAWAGGRAIARYIGPQIAGMAQGVSAGRGSAKTPTDIEP